jgi:hypothetical protein
MTARGAVPCAARRGLKRDLLAAPGSARSRYVLTDDCCRRVYLKTSVSDRGTFEGLTRFGYLDSV